MQDKIICTVHRRSVFIYSYTYQHMQLRCFIDYLSIHSSNQLTNENTIQYQNAQLQDGMEYTND